MFVELMAVTTFSRLTTRQENEPNDYAVPIHADILKRMFLRVLGILMVLRYGWLLVAFFGRQSAPHFNASPAPKLGSARHCPRTAPKQIWIAPVSEIPAEDDLPGRPAAPRACRTGYGFRLFGRALSVSAIRSQTIKFRRRI
jgi:hypothetical protein